MGYAVKLQPSVTQVYNGDKVDVALTGSNTGTFVFTVVYVAKDEICLLSDSNMGNANWSTACAKSWNWECTVGGKTYRSSDAGQSVAKIPSLKNLSTKCHCWDRGNTATTYDYWTGDKYYNTYPHPVATMSGAGNNNDAYTQNIYPESYPMRTFAFISIVL